MKIILPIIFLLISIKDGLSQEQNVGKFQYNHTVEFFGNKTLSRFEDLFFDGKSSVYVVYGSSFKGSASDTTLDQLGGSSIQIEYLSFDDKKDYLIYHNFDSRLMISNEFLENNSTCIVNDSIPKLNWKLDSEYKKIGSFNCQKATVDFRCARYTAWFTTDIPVPFGPWKLSGLPGLIVELLDERETVKYKYTLTKAEYPISNSSYPITPPKPKKKEKTYTLREYIKVQKIEAEKIRVFETANNGGVPPESFTIERECYEGY